MFTNNYCVNCWINQGGDRPARADPSIKTINHLIFITKKSAIFLRVFPMKNFRRCRAKERGSSEWGGGNGVFEGLGTRFFFSFSSFVLGVFARCLLIIIVWNVELITGGDRPARADPSIKTINHLIFITKKSAIFLRVFPMKNFRRCRAKERGSSEWGGGNGVFEGLGTRFFFSFSSFVLGVFARCLLIIIVWNVELITGGDRPARLGPQKALAREVFLLLGSG